ncbi:MAG: DNA translocase FtsK [Acidimicrobiia bacterium]|nr:DNA translocase FtsK [Acidimicrobiia bacterium]
MSQVHANREQTKRIKPRGGTATRRASGSKSAKPQASGRSKGVRQGSRGQPRESLLALLYERLRYGIGRQAHHLIGLALALAGVVVALAFVEAAGPLGQHLLDGLRLLLGMWVYLSPLVLLGLGGTLLLGRSAEGYRRILFGALVWLVGLVGLFHLMTGNPALAAGTEGVKHSGGVIGSLVAFPLERTLGFWGAFVVLVVVSSGGVMMAMRASIGEVLVASGELSVYTVRVIRARLSAARVRFAGIVGGREERRRALPSEVSRPRRPIRPPKPAPVNPSGSGEVVKVSKRPAPGASKPGRAKVAGQRKASKKPSPAATPPDADGYRLPPLDLLDTPRAEHRSGRMVQETARQLEATLHDHEVNARLTNVVSGPTVTRYEIELAAGVKVARVTNLAGDIAYALATPDVRLLAPIPGRSAIGVEVPNRHRRLVTLGHVLSSEESTGNHHPLAVGLGEDISGRPVLVNLAELPHLLIAGATGAGKSSCINSIVTSILMRTKPEDVRLIMVDPKRVELGQYNGVPHLLTRVITKPKKALEALHWAVGEMDRRYELLAESGVRDITGYREKYDAGGLDRAKFDRFPFLVVIVDELNDLMMVAGRDVETAIVRIAQMARAVGIHLVIATQRPSVNVITGVIKANIPSRFAFSVASQADSRVIIDVVGAEKLVGVGDMLVITARDPRPQRVQGAWVSEGEVAAVVKWVRDQKKVEYRKIEEEVKESRRQEATNEDDGEDADLIRQASDLVVRSQLGSTSMLQRKLRIGFARAGRIMDILENRGIVGPSEGSKAREVLVTMEELERERAKVPV